MRCRRKLVRWWQCAGVVALLGISSCRSVAEIGETIVAGEERQLRKRPEQADLPEPRRDAILIIALDGVNAPTLYDALRSGQMPGLATLLGGRELEHAYLHPGMTASLPTITIGAWTTAFTGVPPGQHGVVSNEFFIRETAFFAAPVPVSYSNVRQVLETLNDRTLDGLIEVPTLYERLRLEEPQIKIWVANHPITRGADRLITAEPSALFEALGAILSHELVPNDDDTRAIPAELDEETVTSVIEQIDPDDSPDVLTLYLAGPDHFAHKTEDPVRPSLEAYLRDVIDPKMLDLYRHLEQTGGMDRRYVIVTADHGHTDVLPGDEHALGRKDGGAVQDVLASAGFAPRPPERDVSDPFSAVVAYAGGMALVYLADRSTCTPEGCAWRAPPRRDEDLHAAAEAIHKAVEDVDSPLGGKLDMILVRAESGPDPYVVYVGRGRTRQVEAWLRQHPRPTYIRLPERLRDLGDGPYGNRAGDIILIAHNGNKDEPAERFYFDQSYESWHGSPSARDSIVPLIVGHSGKAPAEIAEEVDPLVDALDDQDAFVSLILALRRGSAHRDSTKQGATP